MAHSNSAKKRIRQNEKRRARNRWRKGQVRDAVKQFEAHLEAGEADKAAEQLRVCEKVLHQTAAKGTIHKNAASRKTARLTKALNKLNTK